MSDSSSNIIVLLTLDEGWEVLQKKLYVKELDATATILLLSGHYHGSGWIVIGDSRFGSVKSVKLLTQKGFCTTMLQGYSLGGIPPTWTCFLSTQ